MDTQRLFLFFFFIEATTSIQAKDRVSYPTETPIKYHKTTGAVKNTPGTKAPSPVRNTTATKAPSPVRNTTATKLMSSVTPHTTKVSIPPHGKTTVSRMTSPTTPRNQNGTSGIQMTTVPTNGRNDSMKPTDIPWHNTTPFKCPVFQMVLFDKIRGFPIITDMTDSTNIDTKLFLPILSKSMNIYMSIKNPRLVAENLIQEVGGALLDYRMRCAATKYQQIAIYVLRKEFQKAVTSSSTSLLSQIHLELKSFKDSSQLAKRITIEVAKNLYETLVEFILREEFSEKSSIDETIQLTYPVLGHVIVNSDLDQSLRYLQIASMWGITRYEAHPNIQLEELLEMIRRHWTDKSIMEIPEAFTCSSLDQLMQIQKRILEAFHNGFWEKESTGLLIHLTRHMIEDIIREHGGNSSATDYVFFPMDRVVARVLRYARAVMNETKQYEQDLLTGQFDEAAKKLAYYLSDSEQKIMADILRKLMGSSVHATTQGPSLPSASDMELHIKKDLAVLRRLLYDTGKDSYLSPNLRIMIEELIREKEKLLSMLNVPRAT